MRRCLSDSEIESFVGDGLGRSARVNVERHLSDCADCRARVAKARTERNLDEPAAASTAGSGSDDETIPAPGGDATTPFPTPFDARMTPLPPPKIEGYEIHEKVFEGAQGVVYRATQLSTNRDVALKFLKEGHGWSELRRARFEREVDVLAQLTHPHIVRIYDCRITDEYAYFVMEFIDGVRLDQYFENRPLLIRDRLEMFRDVAEAVGYAHSLGVIHRDLKPGNILVGEDGEPHVVDFGLAKWSDRFRPDASRTREGVFMGTFAYASPEQTRGKPDLISPAADVYSLGVLMYESVTGQRPYPVTEDMQQTIAAIRHDEPKKPSRLTRGLGDEIDTIVLQCLRKEAERRYATASDLADDIGRYLDGLPIHAKQDSMPYRIRKEISRLVSRHNWTALIAIALVAVFAAVFFQGSRLLEHHAPWSRYPDRLVHRLALDCIRAAHPWHPDVVVVGIDDETSGSVSDLVDKLHLSGVTAKDFVSWRALHGAFLERLASAPVRPKVVAWDVNFGASREGVDGVFVRGIEALQKAGGHVVVAMKRFDEHRDPLMNSDVLAAVDGVGWYWVAQDNLLDRFVGTSLLVYDPPFGVSPSLALVTYLQYLEPGLRPTIEWHPSFNYYDVSFHEAGGGETVAEGGKDAAWTRGVMTNVLEGFGGGLAPVHDVSGRLCAYTEVSLPARLVLDDHTIPYHKVFSMSASALAETFGGKIVMVGDMRRDTVRPVDRDLALVTSWGESREEWKVYLHAAALTDLLNGIPKRQAGLLEGLLTFVLAGVAGVGIGVRFGGRRGWLCRVVSTSLAMTLLAIATFVIGVKMAVFLPLTGSVVALLIGVAGALWVSHILALRESRTAGVDPSRTTRVATGGSS